MSGKASTRPSLYFSAFKVAAVVALLAAGHQFVTNLHRVPVTERTQVVALPREYEMELGESTYEDERMNNTVIEEGPLFERVARVASRLAMVAEHLFKSNYKWEYCVVENPAINAFCCPGGKIVVYTGMMQFILERVEDGTFESFDDALAVVLSHEVAHAIARHSAERLSLLPVDVFLSVMDATSPILDFIYQLSIKLPFSRIHENEADHIGLILMSYACYSPEAASLFWVAMCENKGDEYDVEAFFSTHPASAYRANRLKKLLSEAQEAQKSASWCKLIEQKYRNSTNDDGARTLKRIRTYTDKQNEELKVLLDELRAVEDKDSSQ